jgi:hypothetical protein
MNTALMRIAAAALVALGCAAPLASAQASVPKFQPESLSEFRAALQYHVRHSRQSLRVNTGAYRAYRFVDPDMVIVGVARAVTVDARGRLHIDQAKGQPMGGHLNPTHAEYSHVLLPVNVSPPKWHAAVTSVRRCSAHRSRRAARSTVR